MMHYYNYLRYNNLEEDYHSKTVATKINKVDKNSPNSYK